MCKDCTFHFNTNGDILRYIKIIQTFQNISYSRDECGNIFSLEVKVKTKKKAFRHKESHKKFFKIPFTQKWNQQVIQGFIIIKDLTLDEFVTQEYSIICIDLVCPNCPNSRN